MSSQARNLSARLAADPSSGRHRRGIPARRRCISTGTGGAQKSLLALSASAEQRTPSPVGSATVLRRWSVAELIARAAATSMQLDVGSR